jgi:hypothetical protein
MAEKQPVWVQLLDEKTKEKLSEVLDRKEYREILAFFLEWRSSRFTRSEVRDGVTSDIREHNVNYVLAWLLEHNVLDFNSDDGTFQLDTTGIGKKLAEAHIEATIESKVD